MTKAKTQAHPDMPVFSENRPPRATIRAQRALAALWTEKRTLRAVSDDLAKVGHKFSAGYISLVMKGQRPPSKELLIALGIRKPRKPRKPLTSAEREARKETREITKALWLLYSYVEAGRSVQLTNENGMFFVRVSRPDIPDLWGGAGDPQFSTAAKSGAKMADGDFGSDDPNLQPENLDYVFRHFRKRDTWQKN